MINKNNFLNSSTTFSNMKSSFESFDILNKPVLIEPGIKYYLNSTLKNIKKTKNYYSNSIYNIVMGVLFILIFGSILWYMYKNKKNVGKKEKDDIMKKHYILSKLQQLNAIRVKNNDITNLPNWNDHPELTILQNKNNIV